MRAWLAALALALAACAPGEERLEVFAAASLRDVLVDLERAWGEPLAVNCAGSNLLAEQLRAGARADLFLSAGAREVEALEATEVDAAVPVRIGDRRLGESLDEARDRDLGLELRQGGAEAVVGPRSE